MFLTATRNFARNFFAFDSRSQRSESRVSLSRASQVVPRPTRSARLVLAIFDRRCLFSNFHIRSCERYPRKKEIPERDRRNIDQAPGQKQKKRERETERNRSTSLLRSAPGRSRISVLAEIFGRSHHVARSNALPLPAAIFRACPRARDASERARTKGYRGHGVARRRNETETFRIRIISSGMSSSVAGILVSRVSARRRWCTSIGKNFSSWIFCILYMTSCGGIGGSVVNGRIGYMTFPRSELISRSKRFSPTHLENGKIRRDLAPRSPRSLVHSPSLLPLRTCALFATTRTSRTTFSSRARHMADDITRLHRASLDGARAPPILSVRIILILTFKIKQ